MFWGMRENKQHLTLSPLLALPLPTAHRVLNDALCNWALSRCHGKFLLCHHLGGACGNSSAAKEFSFYPNICLLLWWKQGVKFSYVHKVKMEESEKISVFSKRNLLDLSSLSLNCTVTLMLMEGGIATQASLFHCQTGLKTVYFSCVILCSFPSLGPGDQIGNTHAQSCL